MIRSIFILILTLWISSISAVSHAALSVSTVHYIMDRAPKFSAELEQQIIERHFSLLKFNYLGGTYNNDSIQTMPLIDPQQTVMSFIQQITLYPIILNEGDAIDSDGNDQFSTQFDNIVITIRDNSNQIVNPNSHFCEKVDSAPMRLEISTDVHLSTRYSVSNSRIYHVNQTYWIPFKPTICYRKPSLIDKSDR